MSKTIKFLLFVALVGTILTSCNKFELQEEPLTASDSLRFDKRDKYFDPYDTGAIVQSFDINIHLFKGSTWRMWRKILKECMENEWVSNASYFGPSNTISIGDIIDKYDGLERSVGSALTEQEIQSIIKPGTWTQCNYTQELTINLNTFLQSNFNFTDPTTPDLFAELSTEIKKASSTKVKIDSWRTNNLDEGPLKDLVKNSLTGKKKAYYEALIEDGSRIISTEIEVKGFSSVIELSTEMSVDLEAKLKQGVIAKVGDAGFDAKFKYLNRRTIEVTSSGNFRPFVVKKKGKRV